MTEVEKVKALCKERKVSYHKLEMDLGFANGYIGQLKKGFIPSDRLRKIADYFDAPMNYFSDEYYGLDVNPMEVLANSQHNIEVSKSKNESDDKKTINTLLASAFWNTSPERRKIVAEILGIEFHETEEKVKTLPFYGNIAAAGTSVNSYDILMHGTIECPDNRYTVKADYAIGVCGDSMEPEFNDGDIVIVIKRHTIDYGAIGIFQVDNDIYIKKLTRDGLRSLNENYPTIKNSRDIICLGEVIGRIEDLK